MILLVTQFRPRGIMMASEFHAIVSVLVCDKVGKYCLGSTHACYPGVIKIHGAT
eukprot:COSAG06_NODE_534_length_14525_cov_90.383058_15_plen_54_part_00